MSKFLDWYWFGGKVPRKVKNKVLGTRPSPCKLRRMLKSVTLGEPIRTMYERREIYPSAFCPNCGEEKCTGSGNLAEYPEHWERYECVRCRKIVGYIDNSPYIHALECKDDNYNPVF